MYAGANNHHGAGHHAIWVKSTPLNQEFMVRDRPTRFFVPPYVGPSGWVGVRLDARVNWTELRELLADAHELVTAKKRR